MEPRGWETVLLVEDDKDLRGLAREILVGHGYTVLEAADGSAGLRFARAYGGEIQLLLTDVVMPEMSGRELAKSLSAEIPALKVLFMSGYSELTVPPQNTFCGAPFLPKPFTFDHLVLKVREVLDDGVMRAA